MGMDRRQFLKAAAVLGGAAIVGVKGASAAGPGPEAVVVQAHGKDYARLARASVEALGGMGRFVKKGDKVVVKPNIGWDRKPEYAGNTHPELVREVALMCLEAGAAKVMVFDRTCNDPRRCYVQSGIQPALDAIGDRRVVVSHMDERRFREVEIEGGRALARWSFYGAALEADRFINMPIAKHHGTARLTLAMKNVMGVIGGNRSLLHRDIHNALVDINRVVRSHLTVLDATRILVANGPQGGSLDDVRVPDTVIAGPDVVAVDSVAAGLFGLGPYDVEYITLGEKAGLGVADPARIRVKRVEV